MTNQNFDPSDEIDSDAYEDLGDEVPPDISRILSDLPGFEEDLYLKMQATNLHMVDGYIRDLEANLLRSYFELERTPLPETMFVSALSQLWTFGVYELLRTWRQRVQSVLEFSDRVRENPDQSDSIKDDIQRNFVRSRVYPEEMAVFAFSVYERVAADNDYADRLRTALDASELVFRRIEALRMMLAKHELPRQKGVAATAPGYGRIDMSNGSIYWQVELTELEVDVVSRRAIAQSIASLEESIDHRVLSPALQHKVRSFPNFSYALKKVTVQLSDGTRIPGTLIAWNKIIVDVLKREDISFDANEVVDVTAEEGSIEDDAPEDELAF